MMDLSNLSPTPGSTKKRKRIGRGPGSGHGKTSGKGHKGQKARSGYSRRFGFEGGQMPLNRRLPKRGFNHMDRHEMTEVNLDVIAEHFEDGAEINLDSLLKNHVIKKTSTGVKVLGRGQITRKVDVHVHGASKAAQAAIEAAGGSVTIIPLPYKVRPAAKGNQFTNR
mgnify:CR=1 FL=1